MAQVDIKTEEVCKTEDFEIWKAYEPDEEVTYHIELGRITIHFFKEEWEEFIDFSKEFLDIPLGTTGVLAESQTYLATCEELNGDIIYSIEMPEATLYFTEDDWKQFIELLKEL